MKIDTEITRLFKVRYPIVCAPMFLVSDEAMVVAATKAGGIGAFPALNFRPIEKYREALSNIRKQTQGVIGVNIIANQKNTFAEAHMEYALEAKVDLIITSLGSPKRIIEKAHSGGAKVFCDVVGLEHAKKVADMGADGLIAVGSGAGGHAGTLSLFALIPYLKKNIRLPIFAAGSIGDGRGMAAAFSLGADGIYMGTRFIASKESGASEEYKKAILGAEPEDIVNTDRVDGFPGNFILNPVLKQFGVDPPLLESIARKNKKVARGLSLLRASRALFGFKNSKVNYKSVFSAGHGVGMISEIKSIQEIMDEVVSEYFSVLKNLPGANV